MWVWLNFDLYITKLIYLVYTPYASHYLYFDIDVLHKYTLVRHAAELSIDDILARCYDKIQFIKWSLNQEPSMFQLQKYDDSLQKLDRMLLSIYPDAETQQYRIVELRSMINELRKQISHALRIT